MLYVSRFKSPEDLCVFLENTPRTPGAANLSETSDPDWGGVPIPEAISLVRNGWKEGREYMVNALSLNAPSVVVHAPKDSLDVGGAYPFIPAAVAGDPMNMWNINSENAKGKPIIKFYVSIAYNAHINDTIIRNIGGTVLGTVDQMEQNGYQVELIVYDTAKGYSNLNWVGFYTVKNAGEPLDIDRAAFMLSHTSMLRRVSFGVQERVKECAKLTSDGYGAVMPLPVELVEPQSIVMPAFVGADLNGYRLCSTQAGAATWIKAAIAKSEFAHLIAE